MRLKPPPSFCAGLQNQLQLPFSAEEQAQASDMVGQSMNEIATSIISSSKGAEESARTADNLVRWPISLPNR